MRLCRTLAAVALVPILACGNGNSSATRPDDAVPAPVVVALGDSLTAGLGLGAAEAYPALLEVRLRAAGYPHRMVNAGVPGDTSADALRRLDDALVADTRVLIVALGANDGLRGVPVGDLKRNLSEIIERSQRRGIRILLCGMETPPSHGWDYTVAFHHVFPDLASQYNVPLMPFLLVGVVGNPDLNLGDGIHPNAAGARRIAESMWPYLEPLVRATAPRLTAR